MTSCASSEGFGLWGLGIDSIDDIGSGREEVGNNPDRESSSTAYSSGYPEPEVEIVNHPRHLVGPRVSYKFCMTSKRN